MVGQFNITGRRGLVVKWRIMTALDFGFALFQYSLVLVCVGMVAPIVFRFNGPETQKPKKRWAYPLLVTCFSVLVLTSVAQFIRFVQAFQ